MRKKLKKVLAYTLALTIICTAVQATYAYAEEDAQVKESDVKVTKCHHATTIEITYGEKSCVQISDWPAEADDVCRSEGGVVLEGNIGEEFTSKLIDNKITKEDLVGYGIEDLYYTAEVTYESGNNEESKYSKKYEIEDEKVVKYIPAEKGVYTFRWSEYQNGELVTVMSEKINVIEKNISSYCPVTSTPTPNVTSTGTVTDTPSETNKSIKIVSAKFERGKKKIVGNLSVKGAAVKVKVGKAAYKKASVKGKKFVVRTSKLKKNTKVIIKVTKDGYASLKKQYIL